MYVVYVHVQIKYGGLDNDKFNGTCRKPGFVIILSHAMSCK